MPLDVGQVDPDIGALGDDSLRPGSRQETVSRLAVPDQLTLPGLGARTCGQVVLAAVTIDVYPVAHVVEVAGLVSGNLVKGFLRMEISL